MRLRPLALAAVLALVVGDAAQTATTPPNTRPLPRVCDKAPYRQLDFRLSDWDVYVAGIPQLAGRSLVEKVYNGCVLRENWTSPARGFPGGSLNIYEDTTGRWRQTWADASGEWTEYSSVLVGAESFTVAETDRRTGAPLWRRMTLAPQDDASLRQRVETPSDGGESWRLESDLAYRRPGPRPR